VFGTYPYLDAAPIGEGGLGAGAIAEPEDTVRGYRARRYLGDSSAWANAGLRLRVSHINLILPGAWGIEGFGDVGRVWLKGESSDTWHTGVGGGIWLSLLADRMAFSSGISHSTKDDIFYFTGGFSY
jgi:hemolysin activation/secretion protein